MANNFPCKCESAMKTIGIIGGVASGKSLVASMLRELGAAVLDGDAAGHEVLRMPEVRQAAVARWGDGILAAGVEIDRSKVAAIVFAPTDDAADELIFLETVPPDRIGQKLSDQIDALSAAGETTAAILDAPVLLKAGWDRYCDRILFVDAPAATRLRRARDRGWSEAHFSEREAAQTEIEAKRRSAHIVIDNSGDQASTRRQVREFWDSLGR
jgi:dephospho-CoA kinase